MQLHRNIQLLAGQLREIERLLRQNGETFWSQKIARAAENLMQSDAEGLAQFLGMFGGAGSLNDAAERFGQDVRAAVAQAYRLAERLRREEDVASGRK